VTYQTLKVFQALSALRQLFAAAGTMADRWLLIAAFAAPVAAGPRQKFQQRAFWNPHPSSSRKHSLRYALVGHSMDR
jgi:hypothetical protein